MTTTKFKVSKLDCHSCAMVIEGLCEDLEGVQKAEVNARKRQLTVEHDEVVDPSTIQSCLCKEGYPVEPDTEE